MSEDAVLLLNGVAWQGWTSIKIMRGIERIPSSFELELTAPVPGSGDALTAPWQTAQILLIDQSNRHDVVVTGYVDAVDAAFMSGTHIFKITGRGKCQDLVDCSAEWPSNQILSSDVGAIARKLAAPYGIEVKVMGDPGPVIPTFNINWGDTPWHTIETIARFRSKLIYEDENGALLINDVGADVFADGAIEQGINVESAHYVKSMNNRFSDYLGRMLRVSMLAETGAASDTVDTVNDPGVPRHRAQYIIAESGDKENFETLKARLKWQAARNAGRANKVMVTVDSWRDKSNALWTPNTMTPVRLPALGLAEVNMLISDVTYRRDGQGTHADLILMPYQAFIPQPFNFQPGLAGVKG